MLGRDKEGKGLRHKAGALVRRVVEEFGPREWHIYGGLALLVVGCARVSEALALVVAGGVVLALPAYLRWLAVVPPRERA